MAKTGDEGSEHLLHLAEQLDRAGSSLRAHSKSLLNSGSDASLSERDRDELQRVQDALEFIHSVCPSPMPAGETPIGLGPHEATPTGATHATLNDHADRKDWSDPAQTLGRFQLQELIGEGGFAKVYKAYDPQLNRPVALKLLRQSLFFSEEVQHRFDREAQAAAILNHPGIVPVYESGMVDQQRYIASGYCQGTTLESWLSERELPLPIKSAVELILPIADALEHAHQRGIVHRDLKPANILVDQSSTGSAGNPDQLPGQLRIADFGLAKHATTTSQMRTSEGAIVGTPAYMSPEQAAGHSSVDGRSDVYSLGVLLYEVLTGAVPILGKSNIDTLLAIREQQPVSPRQKRREIPRDLEAICLKCLAKEPDTRYQTAFELAADLRRWLQGEPVSARSASSLELTRKWIARNPGFTVAFGLILSAFFLAFWQWRAAIRESNRAEKHLALSQQVMGEMVSRVTDDPDLPDQLRLELAQEAAKFQDQLFQESSDDIKYRVKALRAYNRLARMLFDQSDYDAALPMIDYALELGEPFAEHPDVKGYYQYAVQVKSGILTQLDQSEKAAQVVSEASEASQPANPMMESGMLFSRAMALLNAGKFQEGCDLFEQSAELVEEYRGENRHKFPIARTYLFWGRALKDLGKFKDATDKTRVAMDLLEPLLEGRHGLNAIREEYARCCLQLTEITLQQVDSGEPDADQNSALMEQARDALESSLELFALLVEDDPRVDRLFGQYGYAYFLLVNLDLQQEDLVAAAKQAEAFAAMSDNVPPSNAYLSEIANTLLNSWLSVRDAYAKKGDDQKVAQLNSRLETMLQRWSEQFPDFEGWQAIKDRIADGPQKPQ